jgi:spore coat protein A, manganese oxidase
VTDSPTLRSDNSDRPIPNGSASLNSSSDTRSTSLAETAPRFSRRDVIKTAVFATAAVALPLKRVVRAGVVFPNRMAESNLPAPFTVPFAIPPVAVPTGTDATTDYYHLEMIPSMLQILPGYQTPMYTYNGTFPGPTIKVQQGRRVRMRQCNELPSRHATLNYEPWTSVHLHGSPSLPQYDGYASDITRPNQYKDYHYPNTQTARTLWYHDHGLHHTAENVYQGLAAQYLNYDPQEQALPIPHGEYDLPLIVSDAMFKNDGSLLFSLDNESGMYGDVILVNGRPWPAMQVKRRKYRFRVLNASISRSYAFSLDSGDPVWIIGTDGGLMPAPQAVKEWKHGMAERYEVIIDFSKYPPGRRVVLRNRSPKNNQTFSNTDKVMAFDVVADNFDPSNNSVPDVLNPSNPAMLLNESDAVATRKISLFREHGQWTVNGNTWDRVVQSNYTHVEANPTRGTAEIWEIENLSGGWFHPFHIHLVDFKVLDRNGKPPFPWEKGPKDVVYMGENEKVRLLMRFDGVGKYMIHCHNLIHEDHDMMSQFEVIDPNATGDHPLSAPCKNLPETD